MFNMLTVVLMLCILLLCMVLPAIAEVFTERK